MQLSDVRTTIQYWASHEVFDEKTRGEVQALIDADDTDSLLDRFGSELEFGTAGLRGIMGAGTARMNVYNVRKASAALASYLRETQKGDLSLGITFDSRHQSVNFAKACAEVMAGYGIKTFITKELRPVPMLSFLVRQYGCAGGVCLTASHNPPAYNGFKVYWNTGGQIVPPHDKNIIEKYRSITALESIDRIPFEKALAEGLIEEVGEELDDAYFEALKGLRSPLKTSSKLKVVFTPLHGTAGKALPRGLKLFGFDQVSVVPSQCEPDGDFPTVKFPNPEDPEALALAIAQAKEENADLVLATDPDCDRIGIAVRAPEGFVRLNGNEIKVLLVDYVLKVAKQSGNLPASPLVIKTIVTTDMEFPIAESYGAVVEETLTGFKWIANRIEDYESGSRKPYRKFLCGGEEAHGFLAGTFVRDKDGLSACCLAAEMASYYQAKGKTLLDVLDDLSMEHGVFVDAVHAVTLAGLEGRKKIDGAMERLRQSPPETLNGDRVVERCDFLTGHRTHLEGEEWKPLSPLEIPQSNVLQFYLADRSKISVRPSGTEPKIKFYFSMRNPAPKTKEGLVETKATGTKRIQDILNQLLAEAGI